MTSRRRSSRTYEVMKARGIQPDWVECPNCKHHEMSHKFVAGDFQCTVWGCECSVPESRER